MPKNKNASYRYRLIDSLLSGGRKWAFEAFLEEVGERLCEEFDVKELISERTLVTDIQVMRKLPPVGFDAPILRRKKMIYYSNAQYSIHDLPLVNDDRKTFQDALSLLRQFKGLPHSGELMELLQRMEAHLPFELDEMPSDIIFVEQNKGLKGLKWISPLFSHISQRKVVQLTYKSFKRPLAKVVVFQPYFLKEFNNRWFVLGYHVEERKNWLFALDRIVDIQVLNAFFTPNPEINGETYFQNIIGVTLPANQPIETIKLSLSKTRAPYVLTKPIHTSQKRIATENTGKVIIELQLIINKELMSELLSFGADLEVLAPVGLRKKMKILLEQNLQHYQ